MKVDSDNSFTSMCEVVIILDYFSDIYYLDISLSQITRFLFTICCFYISLLCGNLQCCTIALASTVNDWALVLLRRKRVR